LVHIDLEETPLRLVPFAPVKVDEGRGRWHDIRVVDGVWCAACDPESLEKVLTEFVRWSEPEES